MKKGLENVTRAYLGNKRASRWYLGSTMILDQEVSFDRDYVESVANLFTNYYGYASGYSGSLTPDDLQGATITQLMALSVGSVVTLRLDAEVTGLESITLYAESSTGSFDTLELIRQPDLVTYEGVSASMLTVFVSAFVSGLPMDVNLTGTIV